MSALAVVTKPADQHTDDGDLVAAVRAGDDRAFEVLFVRYQGRIAAYVRGMVRDRERAEDVTQEVFIAALRRLRATDAPIAFKPWIYEIAKNACIDAYRRTRHVSEVSFDDDDAIGRSMVASSDGPDAAVDAKLAIDNLCGAFGGLSQTHHDILVMREFEDLSYREIGERLGMSHAAVESTLFRARRRLSEEYDELVSGERCLRVRAIVDAPPGRAVGARDQRRMARHIAHCQPCRRHARLAGVDLDVLRTPVAARIAALIPLPAFVRRRFDLDEGSQLLGSHGASAAQWSKVVAVVDPATISGWPRAIAAAATVAAAGLGAGAAVGERDMVRDAVSQSGGARIAPVLAPSKAAPERALGVRTKAATAAQAAPAGSNAAESGRDPKEPGSGQPGEPEPLTTGHVPAGSSGSSGSAPASQPEPRSDTTSSGGHSAGSGAQLPDTGLPSVDVTAGDVPDVRPTRERRGPGLIEGVGTAVGGVDPNLPDTLGHVVSSLGNTVSEQNAGGATGSATGAGSAPVTSGPVSSAVGQLLGGAGTG